MTGRCTKRSTQRTRPKRAATAVSARHGDARRRPAFDHARHLLEWYDRHRRRLPWRAQAGERADPYAVWLSEIMLQQTTVAAVAPYYARFLALWPDVRALAAATLDEVLVAWQGLGYYARARNLHRAARVVANDLGGVFPDTEDGLRALPGVGAYTAAAVAAIAFDRRAAAVDANVERVIARLFCIATPMPRAKTRIRTLAASLVPERRPGDFAQAAMDLGATLCTPRAPSCDICPLAGFCAARGTGRAEEFPRRAPRKTRARKRAIAFWAMRADGAVLLRRREDGGLLGSMIELPSTAWRAGAWRDDDARRAAPLLARWRALPGTVEHVFTHLEIAFRVLAAPVGAREKAPEGCFWWPLARLAEQALPTMTKKLVAHARAFGPDGRRR
ncbi:MAG: A/G-specific adenine glycosylase [Alphaproteobacteria bacterium]